MPYPKQAASIHVEQLGNELCIYNWQRKEVHALNPTAARVWQQCRRNTKLKERSARQHFVMGGLDHRLVQQVRLFKLR